MRLALGLFHGPSRVPGWASSWPFADQPWHLAWPFFGVLPGLYICLCHWHIDEDGPVPYTNIKSDNGDIKMVNDDTYFFLSAIFDSGPDVWEKLNFIFQINISTIKINRHIK